MSIEQVEQSYFRPLIKDKVRVLNPGDKGAFTFLREIEVIFDDTIRIKGNNLLLLPEVILKGKEINRSYISRGDSLHFFPPRMISYRYIPNDKK